MNQVIFKKKKISEDIGDTADWVHPATPGTSKHLSLANEMIGWRQRGYGFHHEAHGQERLYLLFYQGSFPLGAFLY